MTLYIRALTLYHDVIFMMFLLGLCNIAVTWLSYNVKYSRTAFVSKVLPYDGWWLQKGMLPERNYMHRVLNRGNIVPLLLYSLLLIFSCVGLGILGLKCYEEDFLPYAFWGILQLFTSISMWCVEMKNFVSYSKHHEYLQLREVCQCCTDPFSAILLYIDTKRKVYTRVVPNIGTWNLGTIYDADCAGQYIDYISDDPLDMSVVEKFTENVRTSHKYWNSWGLPVLCFAMSAVSVGLFFLYSYYAILGVAVTSLALGIIHLPRERRKALKVEAIRCTKSYTDVARDADWTFVLIGRNGRPYYYLTDDIGSLHTGRSYMCDIKGNVVTYVESETDKKVKTTYAKPDHGVETFLPHMILVPAIVFSEMLGFHYVSVAIAMLWSTFVVELIRYYQKGEI